jgi:hypothetical protein
MESNKTAQTVFRSFVEGSVLLVLAAMLATVSITRIDTVNAATDQNNRPVQASLFPSIVAATPPLVIEEPATSRFIPESVSTCNVSTVPDEIRVIDLQRVLSHSSHSLEILEQDGDKLIIRILRTKRSEKEPVRLPV